MKNLHFLISVLLGSLILSSGLMAQTPAEVRRAFVNLRSDHIKHNCGRAMDWLYAHRDALKDQMVEELYQADRQGRDALLHVLFNTASFVADDRFRRLVIARLPEEDSQVSNFDIVSAFGTDNEAIVQAHWEAWHYIDTHFKDFEPLLKEQISSSNSMYVLWGTTWILSKHQALKQDFDLYTDEVMTRIASNLKDDDIPYNGGQAVRVFLLLGNHGVSTLQKSARSKDWQMASFSRALIDAIQHGRHDAFGYLNAQVWINRAPTLVESDELEDPEWLSDLTQKYIQALDSNPHLPYP
jgi:hypothetical protein